MNYIMLLSLMVPVIIILFLVSALYKEENNSVSNKQTMHSSTNATGDLCCQKINNGDKRNPKNYTDLSGGNWGI